MKSGDVERGEIGNHEIDRREFPRIVCLRDGDRSEPRGLSRLKAPT